MLNIIESIFIRVRRRSQKKISERCAPNSARQHSKASIAHSHRLVEAILQQRKALRRACSIKNTTAVSTVMLHGGQAHQETLLPLRAYSSIHECEWLLACHAVLRLIIRNPSMDDRARRVRSTTCQLPHLLNVSGPPERAATAARGLRILASQANCY